MPILGSTADTRLTQILNQDFEIAEVSALKKAITNTIGGDFVQGTSAGTNYTLTATLAPIVHGTTSPTITIPSDGTYRFEYNVTVEAVGATTTSGTSTIALTLMQTGGGNFGESGLFFVVPVMTTATQTVGVFRGAPCIRTLSAGTIITVNGNCNALPSAGTMQVSRSNLLAVRLY